MNSKRIATFFSWIFNPLLMPAFGLLIMFFSNTYLSMITIEGKKILFLLVFAGTFIIPICFLPIFYYFKMIRNVEMERSERIMPLFITAMVYGATFYVIRSMPFSFINAFIFASALAVLLNAIIALFWKISSHMIGIGGLTGLVTAMYIRYNADISLILVITLLVAGILGFSRLQLEKHTPAQVYAGYLLGLAIVTGTLLI